MYKREMGKLNTLERQLTRFMQYKNPDYGDFLNVWCAYKTLFEFGGNLSDQAYRTLYKKYGNPQRNRYVERLRMYLNYSNEISWILEKQILLAEEYHSLVEKFQELQAKMKNAIGDMASLDSYGNPLHSTEWREN